MDTLETGIGGLIEISGPFGSGKSTALFGLRKPKHVVMVDLDAAKSRERAVKLGIPYYTPEGYGLKDPLDYDLEALSKWFRDTFGKIQAEQLSECRSTILIDNGTALEEVFAHQVRKDPARYGVNAKHAATGSYGGVNPGIGRLWENTLRFLQGCGFRQIAITMHMSQIWAGDAPIEKYKVLGNKALTKAANLAIVLLRSDTPNTPPAALIGKETLALCEWDETKGELKTFMALPPRIPVFTWPNVLSYIDQMRAGKDHFTADEIPTRQEQDRYGPWLSKEQQALIVAVAKNPAFRMAEVGEGGAPETPTGSESVPTEVPAEIKRAEERAAEGHTKREQPIAGPDGWPGPTWEQAELEPGWPTLRKGAVHLLGYKDEPTVSATIKALTSGQRMTGAEVWQLLREHAANGKREQHTTPTGGGEG